MPSNTMRGTAIAAKTQKERKLHLGAAGAASIAPWEIATALATCLLVLVMTLYPFAFAPSGAHSAATTYASGQQESSTDALVKDVIRNILLFAPLGVVSALLLRNRQWRFRRVLVHTLIAGLGLSLTVEFLQFYLPQRESSLSDVLTNGIGILVGVGVYYRWGDAVVRRLETRFRRAYATRRLILVAGLYLVVLALPTALLPRGTYLHNWNTRYPLLLGNENTGDRPWRGRIYELQLANRAMTSEEVAAVLSGDDPVDFPTDGLLASYNFVDEGRVEDRSPVSMPDLQWRGTPPSPDADPGVRLSSEYWLQSAMPPTSLVEKIAETSRFSLMVRFATDSVTQIGPARIFSISNNPYLRNFTLGQQGTALVVRLRTPSTGKDGSNPEWIVPDVLTADQPHRVVITYRPPMLSVYVDRVESTFVFSLTPEILLFRMRPLLWFGSNEIALTPLAAWVYEVLFYMLAFVPLGLLLERLIAQTGRQGYQKGLLWVGAILVPPLLFESGTIAYPGVQFYRLGLGMVLMAVTMAGSWLTLKLSQREYRHA